ncbi:MAG: hypothetical protein FWH20_06045 [Oscillospiraceae bacterium]|nr:hypothetical protein [Oscillospiraceae bacterium]
MKINDAVNYYVTAMNEKAVKAPDSELQVTENTPRGNNYDRLELHRQLEETKSEGCLFDVLAKCIRISNRIIKGDIVPKQDDDFLFEHYPDMHLKAWMLRKHKEDPDEYESELEDEEDEVEVSVVSCVSVEVAGVCGDAAVEVGEG